MDCSNSFYKLITHKIILKLHLHNVFFSFINRLFKASFQVYSKIEQSKQLRVPIWPLSPPPVSTIINICISVVYL